MGPNYSPSGIDGALGPGGAGLVWEGTSSQARTWQDKESRGHASLGPQCPSLPPYHRLCALRRGHSPGKGCLDVSSQAWFWKKSRARCREGGGGRAEVKPR